MGYAGGAEVEQVQLGTELCIHGYDVCFVTYSYGLGQIENICGIEVIKTYSREKARKINALIKFKSIWSALKKANADIYFHEAGSAGVLPLFCYAYKKKFVHRIASDAVVLGKSLDGKYSFFEKSTSAVEVKSADSVIAQSKFQQRILKERFGIQSLVIKNGLILPEVDHEKSEPPVVLWVGSLSKVKNPELFIDLAKSLPNVQFEMVGGRGTPPQLYDEIAAEAQQLSNLKFYGFIPYHEINEYFRRASVFVNTSSMEGFPNTFIQAWANYIPVISFNVDPDDVIRNEKLGFCSGSFKQLVTEVNTLSNDEKLRKIIGNNARKYVEREHDISINLKKYIQIFEEIL
jgi:glycosyltransferase involved in cell wall biosynthesis